MLLFAGLESFPQIVVEGKLLGTRKIGVTIRIVGTLSGTTTDANGYFRISVPSGTEFTQITVSYVGCKTYTIPIDLSKGAEIYVSIVFEELNSNHAIKYRRGKNKRNVELTRSDNNDNMLQNESIQNYNSLIGRGFIILNQNQQHYLAARFYGSKLDSLEIISDSYKELLPDRNGNGIIYTTKSTAWANFVTYDDGGSTLNLKNGSVKFKIADVFSFSITDAQHLLIQEILNKMNYTFGATYKIPIPAQFKDVEHTGYLIAARGTIIDCEKYLSEFKGKNKDHETEITNRIDRMLYSNELFDSETNRIKHARYKTTYDECVNEYKNKKRLVIAHRLYGDFINQYSVYDPDQLIGEAKFMYDLTKASRTYEFYSDNSTVTALKDLALKYPSRGKEIINIALDYIKSFENDFQFKWKSSEQMGYDVKRINKKILEINKFKDFFPDNNTGYLNNLIAKAEAALKIYEVKIPEEKTAENRRAQKEVQQRRAEKNEQVSGAVIQEGEWDDNKIEIRLVSMNGKTLAKGTIERSGNEYGVVTDIFGFLHVWFKTYHEALNEMRIRLNKSALDK